MLEGQNCGPAALFTAGDGSASDRQSGGYFKSLVAAAGAKSICKKAKEDKGLEAGADGLTPMLSHHQYAEAAGEKASAAVLATGGDANAAAVARKQAMQRIIDAYNAGAAAATTAAATAAAEVSGQGCRREGLLNKFSYLDLAVK